MNVRPLALLVFVFLASASAAKAEVYKWVDEDGNVHFTDTPPPKQETEEVRIQPRATQAPSRSNATPAGDPDAAAPDQASLEKLCKKAMSNLRKFTPVWERMIRANFPNMSAESRKAAERSLVEMKADIRKMRSNMSRCVEDMADAGNRQRHILRALSTADTTGPMPPGEPCIDTILLLSIYLL